MVSRLDHGVKQLMDLLEAEGIANNTIVIFTSDNGVHIEGGNNPEVLDSNGPFRGHKRDLCEGGIRTPFIVHWPAKIKSGSISFHVSAFWDFLPTVCDLIGEQPPLETDGISYLPALTHAGDQHEHEYLFWEFHEQDGKMAVLKDNWKLLRFHVSPPEQAKYELYNLNADPSETMDVAAQYPEKVRETKSHHETIPYG